MSTSPQNEHRESATLAAVRSFLLGLFVFALLGTGAELLLLEHFEDFKQWIPLVIMAVSLLVLGWRIFDRGPVSLRAFQIAMALFILSGFIGLFLHYQGNAEFELEMYPSLEGFALFREAIMGATPALAPGAMIQLGLLGLAHTYKHPVLESRKSH